MGFEDDWARNNLQSRRESLSRVHFRTQTQWPTHVLSIWATCLCQFVSYDTQRLPDERPRLQTLRITITYQQWNGIGRSAFETLCQRVEVMLDKAFVRVQMLQSIFEQLIRMIIDSFRIPVRPIARQKVWKWYSARSIAYREWWCKWCNFIK